MLLVHYNYPKNRDDIVVLLNFWDGPETVNNTTTNIQEKVEFVQAGNDGVKKTIRVILFQLWFHQPLG